jgi:hypothetical protein
VKVATFRGSFLCFGLLFWFRLGFCFCVATLGWADATLYVDAMLKLLSDMGAAGFSAADSVKPAKQAEKSRFNAT